MERCRQIQEAHFRKWSADRRYLDLDWEHCSDECPPLLFIGGSAIPQGGRLLVIVSIEPLKADHFPAQSAFAARSIENHRAWNLDFFDRFPGLTNRPTAQPYWSNLAAFVSGWTGDSTAPTSAVAPSAPRACASLPTSRAEACGRDGVRASG